VLVAAAGWLCLRFSVRLNPVEVVRSRFSWVRVPTVAPPDGWSPAGFAWYVEARLALGRWPFGLLAAVAALAAERDLRRDGRRWTEWAGLALGVLLGAAWLVDELALRPAPGLSVRVTVAAAWMAAVIVPARLVAGRFRNGSSRTAGLPIQG
jgi:hypothetical protein